MGSSFSCQVRYKTGHPWLSVLICPHRGLIRKTHFFTVCRWRNARNKTAPVMVKKLSAYHVQAILDYGVEGGNNGEAGFDQACNEFIRVINYAASQPNIPFISIKVTGFARFELLDKT